MSPEVRHQDAIEAAREWRDQQRTEAPAGIELEDTGFRLVWIDSGSGPGYEILVPLDQ
jgi:hypothetical protein